MQIQKTIIHVLMDILLINVGIQLKFKKENVKNVNNKELYIIS